MGPINGWTTIWRQSNSRNSDHQDQGPFSISLFKLSQLKAKSLSQRSNLLQTRFLSCVLASDLREILIWDST